MHLGMCTCARYYARAFVPVRPTILHTTFVAIVTVLTLVLILVNFPCIVTIFIFVIVASCARFVMVVIPCVGPGSLR